MLDALEVAEGFSRALFGDRSDAAVVMEEVLDFEPLFRQLHVLGGERLQGHGAGVICFAFVHIDSSDRAASFAGVFEDGIAMN